jgi:RNA polymerase sigma factor (sigma-70 family)
MGTQVSADMDAFLAEACGSVEESAWARALLPRLEDCLGELSPKAQRVLRLRYRKELTNERIGSLVGGSKQYIGRLIRQSLRALRKCLERGRTLPVAWKRSEGGARP